MLAWMKIFYKVLIIKKEVFAKIREHNFNVLYVEDNTQVQMHTLKMLDNFFPNIICAKDGNSGYDVYEKTDNNINLIITDIQMPSCNGLEMIKRIRKQNLKIPIIIFSAYSNTDYLLDAIKCGIDGYIVKPYSLQHIYDTLVDLITKLFNPKETFMIADDYLWNDAKKLLYFKGTEEICLTKNEKKLITLLVNKENTLLSSEEIENIIFDDFHSNNKKVRNLISRLNSKLGIKIIQSIYGQGYQLLTK